MEVTNWYAVALGVIIVSFVTVCVVFYAAAVIATFGKSYVRRHLFYPQISQSLRSSGRWFDFRPSGKTNWIEVILLLAFLGANAFTLAIGFQDMPRFIRRSGLVPVVNFIPLFLGSQMNIIASRCGVSLRAYARMHRWLGGIVVLEGLVHTAVALSERRPNLHIQSDIAATVAICALFAVLPLGFLRHRVYEIFLSIHFTLCLVAAAAVYIHTGTNLLEPPTVYLFAAVCVQIFTGVVRLGQVLYRNVGYKRPLSRASIRAVSIKKNGQDAQLLDAVHVHVRLSKPWNPRAGQYVYLCIPGASHLSFTQLHPFYITWWYHCNNEHYAVFIIQRQRGFTDHLFLRREHIPIPAYHEPAYLERRVKIQQPAYDEFWESGIDTEREWPEADDKTIQAIELHRFNEMATVIDGPYGKELNLGLYGTVLLFAADIGIAGQLPYVAQLLDGYRNCEVMTRRIALFWQVDSEGTYLETIIQVGILMVLAVQTAWVADRMQYLMWKDAAKILDIHLFVIGDFLEEATIPGARRELGKRIHMTYTALNASEVINNEMKQRKGRTVISLCVYESMNSEIRQLVGKILDETITVKELDFQPKERHHRVGSPTV